MKCLTQEAPAPLAQLKSSDWPLTDQSIIHFGKVVNLGVATHSLGNSNRVTDYSGSTVQPP